MLGKISLYAVAIILAACSQTIVSYPSVCPNGDESCQRNQDAQTLALIGQEEADEQLMRTDPIIADLIDTCSK